jgi:hypothetical protein
MPRSDLRTTEIFFNIFSFPRRTVKNPVHPRAISAPEKRGVTRFQAPALSLFGKHLKMTQS